MQESHSFSHSQLTYAVFQRIRKQTPDIRCLSNNKITALCTNSKCPSALACSNPQCKHCGISVHSRCPRMVPMEQLTEMVNQKTKVWGTILINMFEAEEKLISKMRR